MFEFLIYFSCLKLLFIIPYVYHVGVMLSLAWRRALPIQLVVATPLGGTDTISSKPHNWVSLTHLLDKEPIGAWNVAPFLIKWQRNVKGSIRSFRLSQSQELPVTLYLIGVTSICAQHSAFTIQRTTVVWSQIWCKVFKINSGLRCFWREHLDTVYSKLHLEIASFKKTDEEGISIKQRGPAIHLDRNVFWIIANHQFFCSSWGTIDCNQGVVKTYFL